MNRQKKYNSSYAAKNRCKMYPMGMMVFRDAPIHYIIIVVILNQTVMGTIVLQESEGEE